MHEGFGDGWLVWLVGEREEGRYDTLRTDGVRWWFCLCSIEMRHCFFCSLFLIIGIECA